MSVLSLVVLRCLINSSSLPPSPLLPAVVGGYNIEIYFFGNSDDVYYITGKMGPQNLGFFLLFCLKIRYLNTQWVSTVSFSLFNGYNWRYTPFPDTCIHTYPLKQLDRDLILKIPSLTNQSNGIG